MLRIVILGLVCLAFFTAANGQMPVTDPVESNYALTAKEMVLSGNWLSPQIYGQYWFDKPVMVYWWLAAAFSIFGFSDFAVRLPSAVAAALAVCYTYWFVLQIKRSNQTAWFAALVLATSLEFWILAHMILTDVLLLLFVSVTMGCVYLGLEKDNRRQVYAAYAASGLAVLTKGPVGFVLPGLLILAYVLLQRDWQLLKKLRLLPGIMVMAIVAGPWYGFMAAIHGQPFVETFLGLHNVVRATVSEHPQDNVFYYYLVLFPVSLLPWSLVFLSCLVEWLKKIKTAHKTETYLFVWLLGYNLFFTAMATKYPTYVFPALWPAALLTAFELERWIVEAKTRIWWLLSLPAALEIALFALAGKWLPVQFFWHGPIFALLALLPLLYQQYLNRSRFVVATALTVGLSSILMLTSALIPLTQTRSAQTAAELLPSAAGQVGIYGEYATSAVYYSNRPMFRLVREMQEPQNLWAGKYTMPTQTYNDFLNSPNAVQNQWILVNKANATAFLQENFAVQFQLVRQNTQWQWFERIQGR